MATAARVFIDTNIFVYQFDQTNPSKQARAKNIIGQALASNNGVISTQVVQEFMNVALKKFSTSITVPELLAIMDGVFEPLCHHSPSFLYYKKALKLYNDSSLGFYDALIIQAALDTSCSVLYSEDLQDGHVFGSLAIQNPFK